VEIEWKSSGTRLSTRFGSFLEDFINAIEILVIMSWENKHLKVEEVLSNAVYHRAYDEGEPIEVRVEKDRIDFEFWEEINGSTV